MRPGAGPWRGGLGNHPRPGAAAGRTHYRQARQGIVLRHRSRIDAPAARYREHRADRHHHRCLRPHHDAGGQRPRLRVRPDRGLLRGHRQEQSRPRAENDQDAGRRVRRGRDIQSYGRGVVMIIGETPRPTGALGVDAIAMTMRFGDFLALDNVELKVRPGSFHALLGENGAGKSTLVKCIMGYYHPTEGDVLVGGREQAIANPKDAHALGLGMVYQHFTLVPAMTVAENLVLARDDVPAVVDWSKEKKELEAFLARMPFKVPLDAKVSDISAGERQKCEILKQLYLKRRFLILDEPTSVLTPGEADEVLGMLRDMVLNSDLTILMITHKFGEVGAPRLEVDKLKALDDAGAIAVRDVSLAVRGGEIVGIAGVSGNGQRQLVEVLAGQREAESGKIRVAGDIYRASREEMRRHRMSLLPEEPLKNACVGGMSVADNIAFREFDRAPFASGGWWLNRIAFRNDAEKKIAQYRIKTRTPDTPISALSGGNVQRTVLARELGGDVEVLIAANPCFGLDFAAVAQIHAEIMAARNRGAAVLLVSEDLDELLELSDRLVVMFQGQFVYEARASEADLTVIGRHMAGH